MILTTRFNTGEFYNSTGTINFKLMFLPIL